MDAQARAEWLKLRQGGIGGSDAAAIIGANPHRTALEVYRSKTEPLGPDVVNPAILRGRFMEPMVRRLYEEATGRQVVEVQMTRDREHPFLIANVDGRVMTVPDDGSSLAKAPVGIAEFKVPGLRNFQKWKNDGVAQMYYVQVQHYLMIDPEAEYGGFGIFNAERWELLHFDIPRDELMIEQLREAEVRFWRNHVEKRIPPPPGPAVGPKFDMPEVAVGLVRQVKPELTIWHEALATFYEARELEAMAAANKEAAQEKIKAVMTKLAAEVAEDGKNRVYWQEVKGSRRLDGSLIDSRRLLDRDKLIAAMGEKNFHSQVLADLVSCFDLSVVKPDEFKKQGAPTKPLKVFRLKGGFEEDEE